MNRELLILAIRNIKKYKKHYLFVYCLIFIISICFIDYPIIWENHYYAQKQYYQEMYGEWYQKSYSLRDMNGNYILDTNEIIDTLKILDTIKYAFEYDQGTYEDIYTIARVDPQLYKLCNLQIVEGKSIDKDNEILVTKNFMEEEKLKIGSKLELTINNNINEYTIVGVLQISTDPSDSYNMYEYFPSIYTNIIDYMELSVYSNANISSILLNQCSNGYTKNPYGYAINETIADGMNLNFESYTMQELFIFIEGVFLSASALIILTMTSLQKRTKEFALLRGIGMTTRQLMIVCIEELMLTSFISVILGFVISLPISYLASIYYSKSLSFVYQINLLKIFGYIFILLLGILCTGIYPIYSSARRSLEGTFEANTFQRIQVRYRKLKKQSLAYIALREMKAYKKITLSLIIIFGIIVTYYTCTIDANQYTIYSNLMFENLHYIQIFDNNKAEDIIVNNEYPYLIADITYTSNSVISINEKEFEYVNSYTIIQDRSLLENCHIEGKLPENRNEVLIDENCRSLNSLDDSVQYYIQINDKFIFRNQEYTVVGFMQDNEEQITSNNYYNIRYYPECDVYFIDNVPMDKKDYNQTYFRFYYDTSSQRDSIISQLNSTYYYDSDNIDYSSQTILESISPKVLIIPMIICLIFCYFINQNYMFNNTHTFALSRIIGMTKKDMFIKYIFKAIWTTLFILGIQIFWIICLQFYYNVIFIPIVPVILTTLIVFIINIMIYCLPISKIINIDPIELLSRNE